MCSRIRGGVGIIFVFIQARSLGMYFKMVKLISGIRGRDIEEGSRSRPGFGCQRSQHAIGSPWFGSANRAVFWFQLSPYYRAVPLCGKSFFQYSMTLNLEPSSEA